MLMGKKVVLLRCLYLYEMLPMLLSPPMPLPLPSMSMDPALRLEQRKVFKVLGSDSLVSILYLMLYMSFIHIHYQVALYPSLDPHLVYR